MSLITTGRRAYIVLGVNVPPGMDEATMQQVIMGGVTMTLDVRAHHVSTLVHFAPEGWMEQVLAIALKAQANAIKQ